MSDLKKLVENLYRKTQLHYFMLKTSCRYCTVGNCEDCKTKKKIRDFEELRKWI